MAVSEIDINKLSIEVYDLDFLDYDDQSDSDFSELDRFKRYAGTGNQCVMFVVRHMKLRLTITKRVPGVYTPAPFLKRITLPFLWIIMKLFIVVFDRPAFNRHKLEINEIRKVM